MCLFLVSGVYCRSMECPHVDEAATLSQELIRKVQPNSWACAGESQSPALAHGRVYAYVCV